ncbi:MAG TPA: hypothetical protein VK356_01835 [Thermomicrobiales bacterium]|nr:hypothetical protein [Thermomicrobiales bacterium]
MAPFVMAFSPALPGQPHPAPWKSAGGGIFYDVHAEPAIPADLPSTIGAEQTKVVRLISTLLTLKDTPRVSVP